MKTFIEKYTFSTTFQNFYKFRFVLISTKKPSNQVERRHYHEVLSSDMLSKPPYTFWLFQEYSLFLKKTFIFSKKAKIRRFSEILLFQSNSTTNLL